MYARQRLEASGDAATTVERLDRMADNLLATTRWTETADPRHSVSIMPTLSTKALGGR